MQMKSLLIVKMCKKANIFKNQLGYFRNLWDINKLWARHAPWGFSKICDAHGGSVRVGNYALVYTLYRNL
jgi:hypothetical protein